MKSMTSSGGSARIRHRLLALALLLTALATYWASGMEEESAATVPERRDREGPRGFSKASSVGTPDRPAARGAQEGRKAWREPDPQGLLTWGGQVQQALESPVPTPAAMPDAAVPPPPVAPPFPYPLFGRLDGAGPPVAMLDAPQGVLVVKAGDVLDGQWRVEKIGPEGLNLVWLPTQQPLTVHFKAS